MGFISENFENQFKKFRKVSRNILDIFRKCFGKFLEILLNKQILSCISENYSKKCWELSYFKKLVWKVLRNISNNFDKFYWTFRKILLKPLRIILKNFEKISRNTEGNYENYFVKCWEIFRKILRTTPANFKNKFKKFREVSRNTLDIFRKYFGKFLEILPNKQILSCISKNYSKKMLRIKLFQKTGLKSFEKYFE